ncbi:MAG TPA: tetratricopeptide repeat protein [bacterium]|jgi:hypothetical protein
MKRAAALLLAVLTVCLYAAADPGPATDPSSQAQDFLRFGRQDMAHGLATSALYYFNESLALQPDSPDAWIGKARALERLKRYEEARAAADKAVQLAPFDRTSWAIQGRIYFDQKQYGQALTSLDKSLTLGNADTMVWRWKGQTLDSLNRHDEALNAYAKATPPETPYRGGITRVTRGGPAEATPNARNRGSAPTPDQENGDGNEEEAPSPQSPQGYLEYGPGYGNPNSAYGQPFGESFGQPVATYYEDITPQGYTELYGNAGRHHRRHTYGDYYYNGDEDGGNRGGNGPTPSSPRTRPVYRGVEPLYQQSVVPQYFQSVTPSTDFRSSPDYHGAAGVPIISDRWNFDSGSNNGYMPYGRHNRGGRYGGRGGGRH